MDLSRHISVFDPIKVEAPIHIIGVGATGSFVAMQLARMGVREINIYDFDEVEIHNIPNQMFDTRHLGLKKVEALKSLLLDINPDMTINTFDKRVSSEELKDMSGYMFSLVDSMTTRKEFFEVIKTNKSIIRYWESRLGSDQGRVYCLPIEDNFPYERYEKDFYTDAEAEVSACGTSITVLPGVMQTASLMMAQFIAIVMANENVMVWHKTIFSNMYDSKQTDYIEAKQKEEESSLNLLDTGF